MAIEVSINGTKCYWSTYVSFKPEGKELVCVRYTSGHCISKSDPNHKVVSVSRPELPPEYRDEIKEFSDKHNISLNELTRLCEDEAYSNAADTLLMALAKVDGYVEQP